MALVIGANLSMFFLVVQYDERVLGLGPFATGAGVPALQPRVFGMSRITPWLIARMGARTMIMVGTGGHGRRLRLAQPAQRHRRPTSGSVFGPVLIAGLATGFIFMPITATVLGGVEPEHAGSASGLLQTTQQLGSAVGVAAIVSVYATGAVPGQFVPGVRGGVPHLGGVLAGGVRGRRGGAARPAYAGAGRRRAELEPELAEAA